MGDVMKAILQWESLYGESDFGVIGSEASPVDLNCTSGQALCFWGQKNAASWLRLAMGFGKVHGGDKKTTERKAFGFRRGGLLANLDLFENVALPIRFHAYFKGRQEDRVQEVLEGLNISQSEWRKRPSELSESLRKKALLARAVVIDPELLILDDPSADFTWMHLPELCEWLLELKRSGVSILFSSHDKPFVVSVADEIVDVETRGTHEQIPTERFFTKAEIKRCKIL
jgi:ABC-type transporter Mla maintaining outer membrane lipid asymmetry ATPase subunit MlaF